MVDTMKGLFFIIKGRHDWNKKPTYTNRVTGDVGYLGGYDPEDSDDWYTVRDRKCYHSIYCGRSLEEAISSIRRCIVKHKGVARSYFKEVSKYTSDDYYEVHYLGHAELLPEKRASKCEGRCPRTSPIMQDMYRNIDMLWGDYYQTEIEEQEELAYQDLVDERPVNKSRKILQRARKSLALPVQEKTSDRTVKPTLKKTKDKDVTPTIIRPVAKKPVKLLRV